MSSFTEPLAVKQLDAKNWMLLRRFTYFVGEEDSDYSITVKKGFIFDGGSIPQFAWSLVGSPMGKGGQVYCIHDALYRSEALPRKEADRIMLEGLEIKGYGWMARNTIYYAVRLFGNWSNHTPEGITGARKFVKISK